MLSPLQERVAALVAGMEDASELALAGGVALIVQGRISRQHETWISSVRRLRRWIGCCHW